MPGLSQMKVDQVGQTVFCLWCNSQWCWKLLHQLPQTHKHLWRYWLPTNLCYIMCLCNKRSVECDFCSFSFCRSEKNICHLIANREERERRKWPPGKNRTTLWAACRSLRHVYVDTWCVVCAVWKVTDTIKIQSTTCTFIVVTFMSVSKAHDMDHTQKKAKGSAASVRHELSKLSVSVILFCHH